MRKEAFGEDFSEQLYAYNWAPTTSGKDLYAYNWAPTTNGEGITLV